MERYWNENMECATKDEMKALQSFRLSQTVRKVYNNVPYYRERMEKAGVTPDDIHSVEDLKKLPFTMKQDLRDTYPYGLFAVPMEDVVRVHASSGTTGKQIVVGYTQHDLDVWSECCARALTAAGATNKDFMHVSYGYGLFTGGLGLHGGAEKVGMTVIPVSTGNTNRQINIIKDFGSTYICCTPSYALYLAETMEEMGITKDDIKLKAGLFGAEPWTEEMRHEIEEKLGLKALDIYGLTEIIGPGVAFECSEQSGMHINEDHFIAETIDPDTGEVLPEGTQGEIVIKMMKPAGRSDDMLIIRGVNVFPSQVESVLLQLGNTAPYYQLIVDRVNNTDTLEIQVEISPEMFSDTVKSLEDQEKIIKSAVESTLGIAAKIRLVEPKTIQRTEGKAIRVIDKRK